MTHLLHREMRPRTDIRHATYRGRAGFTVRVGRSSAFVESREAAERIRDLWLRGVEETLADFYAGSQEEREAQAEAFRQSRRQ